ncbi:hypothetical protein RhiirA5_419044 [Rhizophagus irregularis]|uniref:Uncharacterized protein n=2 Tax=Rhizophagus irregularis TaxID=588596 RepID=A0A2I1EJ49_9GLOM|nr:hypothetical protein GLOIN_2v1769950 [Rhizophagus irregularis DAOM 181602=DAOM 197198]PKC06813.1 hypothetical protein RhiirA5_419044 [Rhizophagus irregularis]PKC67866.1 hypothetical protein RhiirA1_457881 [Rhizophagus irregularis]PKY22148.1 hypothetical protein RhiirB3_435981 [Rhizophagus irregularis]POG75714.1 hypothetical protein GLOIN_2v1769950 [Rhizophagus irregularis DAOM 181602=DAOM 197198]UZO23127.1 hypothetical protein OCT59_015471 [Rhizophagus irregularis]|eukprot:XP_025182580.1 hypothetical protein GLOIN_2v1769950 [Rhizophagus irregularis DAOM 181602=DAOM 197198]
MQQSSKPLKSESIIVLILIVGILVYCCFFVQQGQKVDKDETHENKDPNEYLPPTRYDPCADYDKLALETFYKNNPGDPFAEEIKKNN